LFPAIALPSIKKVTCMPDIQVGKTPSRTTRCKQQ